MADDEVRVIMIGSREFLQSGRYSIPIDQIREIDTDPEGMTKPDGSKVSAVNVLTYQEGEYYKFRGEAADGIKEFINSL